MNRDTLTGVVGALVLVGAMVGVFLYERANAAEAGIGNPSDSPLPLVNATAPGPSTTGVAALGGDTTKVLPISQGNLTRVAFTVTWTATNGKNTLQVRVEPPAGAGPAVESEAEDDGSLEVAVTLPSNLTAPHQAGTGDWKVTVAYLRGTGLVPAAPQPLQPDPSVQWNLATELAYAAQKTE